MNPTVYRVMATAYESAPGNRKVTIQVAFYDNRGPGSFPRHATECALALFRQVWVEDVDGKVVDVIKDNVGDVMAEYHRTAHTRAATRGGAA